MENYPRALVTDPKGAEAPRLTSKFFALMQQGQRLPDGSLYIKLDDGSRWAVAAEVAQLRYGYGDDLGPVGEWIKEKNRKRTHGHADWQMPDSAVGRAIYDQRGAGELRNLFASVRALWLKEHDYRDAEVLFFVSGGQLINYNRDSSGHSVCAVRRLDI